MLVRFFLVVTDCCGGCGCICMIMVVHKQNKRDRYPPLVTYSRCPQKKQKRSLSSTCILTFPQPFQRFQDHTFSPFFLSFLLGFADVFCAAPTLSPQTPLGFPSISSCFNATLQNGSQEPASIQTKIKKINYKGSCYNSICPFAFIYKAVFVICKAGSVI